MKINISTKDGKSWKLDLEGESLVGKSLGDKIKGSEISPDLVGYEFAITGASDIAGFPHKADVEGSNLKRVILTKGWGMHKKPRKEGKKKVSTPKGLRLRKTIRGKEISEKTIQINLKIEKDGSKKLNEIFPDQNKPKEEPKKETSAEKSSEVKTETAVETTPAEKPTEEKPSESKPAEKSAEETTTEKPMEETSSK